MEIGAAIFFTDYSMAPTDLAVALEERGFDSLWVAEHSHIPVTRRFTHPLGDAVLTKEYFDVMDPFVTLSTAAAVTKRLISRAEDLERRPANYKRSRPANFRDRDEPGRATEREEDGR
jgi:hypothetical protein